MSVGWDGKTWIGLVDDIYLGGVKVNEVWMGNKKIYPEADIYYYLNDIIVNLNGSICTRLDKWAVDAQDRSTHLGSILVTINNGKWVKIANVPYNGAGDSVIPYNPSIPQGVTHSLGSRGELVAYNGGIHFIGVGDSHVNKGHYVFKNNTFYELADLPYGYSGSLDGRCVVLNGELYVLGMSSSINDIYDNIMYKYNGSEWERCAIEYNQQVSFWYLFMTSQPVVYNNSIYDVSLDWGDVTAVWENPEWVVTAESISKYAIEHADFTTSSRNITCRRVGVYNGLIHVLAMMDYSQYSKDKLHIEDYVFDGSSWSKFNSFMLDDPDYNFYSLSYISFSIHGGLIHIFYCAGSSTVRHYIYNGVIVEKLDDMEVKEGQNG